MTYAEIEHAVAGLSLAQQLALYRTLQQRLETPSTVGGHSVLEIAPVRLGATADAFEADADVLGEMLGYMLPGQP